jgi:hypothetical protein
VSRLEGHLSDSGAQDRLRALERRLSAIEAADLDELLRHDWGRRFYYRITHEMGLLVSSSFEPGIKDGVAAAIHMARNEGIREFAIRLMDEAQAVAPDLWSRMLMERIAGRAEEARQREQASSSSTENDT